MMVDFFLFVIVLLATCSSFISNTNIFGSFDKKNSYIYFLLIKFINLMNE